MQQDSEHVELVRRAVAGDPESLSALAEQARDRVCAYIRRVVLDDERAQDITQEVMVAMLSSRSQLRDPRSFWSWLFTIVNNKIRLHYRRSDQQRRFSDYRDDPMEPPSHELEPAEGLARTELVDITRSALAELDVRYRMVLAMRFYEDLPHSAISGILGCTETSARVTFLRAKRALLRALRKRGLRHAGFGLALTAFGEATRPAAAGTLKVSGAALTEGIRHLLLTKRVSMTLAALVFVILLGSFNQAPGNRPAAPPVALGVHFIERIDTAQCLRRYDFIAAEPPTDLQNTRSKGAYEQWYQFPNGGSGPFLFRVQLWDSNLTERVCWWLQNERANYHVNPPHQIKIHNYHLYSDKVKTLPTDPPDLVQFIQDMERSSTQEQSTTVPSDMPGERDPKTGFLTSKMDYRFPELGTFETRYEYTELPRSLFEDPIGLNVVDERDEMHWRGWTYFRVKGSLGGHRVTGTGQIPFVISTYKTHLPWLRLEIEGVGEIVDTSAGAWTVAAGRASGGRSEFRPETFFRGLSRPWTGFHTIDTIRRDAAVRRIEFATQQVKDDAQFVEVKLMDRRSNPPMTASYRIDMERDVLEQVTFSREGLASQPADVLEFDYVQNLELLNDKFVAPSRGDNFGDSSTQDPGPLWPVLMAGGREL